MCMEMRDIAVITQFIDNSYSSDILQGIQDFFKDKNVRLFILEARSPFSTASNNEYQFWASALLAQSQKIDAVILLSGSYTAVLTEDQLKEVFEPLIHAPVISISAELPLKNSYYTLSDCQQAISETMKHLIQEHGAKKIGFVSSEKTPAKEGIARLEAYKKALEENGMTFDPSIVIPSNFTQLETILEMHKHFKTKEDVKFDALLCANDFSAFGAIYTLKELGLNVPDDILVTGYDDCSTAETMGLSSINQTLTLQGYKAAEIAWNVINGKPAECITKIPAKAVFRRSCGCNTLLPPELANKHFSMAIQHVDDGLNYTSLYSLLDKLQGYYTLTELYNQLSRILMEVDVSAFAICLYKSPVLVAKGMKLKLPESASLKMHYNTHKNLSIMNEDISFDPYMNILPPGILSDEPSSYIVNPIFFGEIQYGYFLYRPGNKDLKLYSVYMKIVSNYISQAFDLTSKLEGHHSIEKANKELSLFSKIDELTKVYNRRGFMFLSKKSIELALQMNAEGMVIYADVDHLKDINDNFGFANGDKALAAIGGILSKCLRKTDVIGRMGGDEFAIVAAGMNEEILKEVMIHIENECSAWTIETKSPFRLSVTLGAIPFDKEKCLLENLISQAEIQLYNEKQKKNNFM